MNGLNDMPKYCVNASSVNTFGNRNGFLIGSTTHR